MTSFWRYIVFQLTDLLFGQNDVIDIRDNAQLRLPVAIASMANQLKRSVSLTYIRKTKSVMLMVIDS